MNGVKKSNFTAAVSFLLALKVLLDIRQKPHGINLKRTWKSHCAQRKSNVGESI